MSLVNEPPPRPANEPAAIPTPTAGRNAFRNGSLAVILLLLAYWWLIDLIRFSLSSSLYSHIGLIPLVSGYFIWQRRHLLPAGSPPCRPLAWFLWAAGVSAAVAYVFTLAAGTTYHQEDALALTTSSFLLCFAGTCAWFLGRRTLRALAFPLGFLVFMVPMPVLLLDAVETALQHGSAAVAAGLFTLGGATFFQDGLMFRLSTITLEVAPECSGVHSSLALLITSIAAGHMFLRSPWKRMTLALAVIPLALLRNGFRIFVIGELCVRISPDMIHSYIHRQGGPIFFALSLIPFSLLLLLLVRSERRAARTPQNSNPRSVLQKATK